MKKLHVLTFSALVSVAWLSPATIWAGGYATARFGGDHGHAASDHVSSIYYNPAGLAFGTGTRVYVEGLFVFRQATYNRSVDAIDNLGTGTPNEDDAILNANRGAAELNNFLVSPFLGVSTDLGIDGLALGFGFYAPFGGQATWDGDDTFDGNEQLPGAVDGAQRWASIEGFHRVIFATAAASYRLSRPRISFGVGLNLVQQSLETVRARNTDGTDDLFGTGGNITEGRTLLEGSQTSFSIGAGVAWQATDALRLGLSYQSMPGFGESELEGTLTSQFGGGSRLVNETTLQLIVPDIVRFGLVYQASPKVEVRLAADYQRWGQFDQHCLLARTEDGIGECAIDENGARAEGGENILLVIPRSWDDTFGVRVGASYWLTELFEAFGGIGYDSNAIPDETLEAGFFDMNKIVTTVGVRYDMMGSKLKLTGSFTNVFYFDREIGPRTMDPALPSRNPDGAGSYEQLINFFTLGAQFSF